jgi:hypothetical protein
MSDWSAPLVSTVVAGQSGSGKNTFVYRLLVNRPASCRFIFDFKGECAARLKLSYASTARECEAALSSRWVIFNPHRAFPGEMDRAFRWFCHWSFEASKRGRGRKIFYADEVWMNCSPHSIPKEFAVIAQMGRAEGIEMITSTQLPHKIHASITGQCTELVCFRLDERLALDCVEELGADRIAVQRLQKFHFISYNRVSQTVFGPSKVRV